MLKDAFPLVKQLLRPLVGLLLLMAAALFIGSTYLLNNNLRSSVDRQLKHAQKMVYHDLKQQEQMLAEYLKLLSQKPASVQMETLENAARTYQPQLDLRLSDLNTVSNEPLHKLLERTRQSRTSLRQITLDRETGKYSLTLVAPATPPRDALLLQLPLNRSLLTRFAERYQCDLSLYSERGHLIASSNDQENPGVQLSGLELERISASSFSLLTSKVANSDYRSIYAPLPIGSNAILYLAASRDLSHINKLVLTQAWWLLAVSILTLSFSALFYFRLLQQVLSPLKILCETIQQVARGDLSCRADIPEAVELHKLGHSFNQMLGQLENLYENRVEAEKTAVLTQETLKYNEHLKKKNLEIEKVNRQLKEQYEELTALFQVSRSLTSALDQNLLFEKIFQVFRDALHCDRIVLLLYYPGVESLEVIKTFGLDASTIKGLSFKLGEGISGTVASGMQSIYSPDLSVDDRNLSYKGRWVSTGSLLSMPMILQNRLIGVLNIHHSEVNAFGPVGQQMAQAIADQAAISIENARLYEKTRNQSATDDLTGLANRRQFQDLLQREWTLSRRYHSSFSLLMLDIDYFKAYNDTHGHLKGDIILKKVAALLLQNTRGIDLVARFGGEEFILLLPKTDRQGSLAVARKLCRCFEAEYFSGMEESQPQKKLTVSIGAATFPADSTDIYTLLNYADEALYKAKRDGRNRAISWTREISSYAEDTEDSPQAPMPQ